MKAISKFLVTPAVGLAMAVSILAAESQAQLPNAGPNGPVIVQGYYQDAKAAVCNGASYCVLTFSAVPTGKTLIVSNVSCFGQTQGTAAVLESDVLVPKGQAPFTATSLSALSPATYGQGQGSYFFNSNNEVQQIFKSGQAPQIIITYQTGLISISMTCQISGKQLT